MTKDISDIRKLTDNPRFPRSNQYDPIWMLENQMGPNAVWLTEWLCSAMTFEPGMRVLDMGCGKALSSVFLAREFGVQVWANDLWIKANENWERIKAAGLEDQIFPIHAEARSLPYADEFFDAIVSIDSYQYYGTDELYLFKFAKLLKPGGQIGIVVPTMMQSIDDGVPEHLTRPQSHGAPFWEPECVSLLPLDHWERLWRRNSTVEIQVADLQPDGWKDWAQWEHAIEATGHEIFPSLEEAIREDAGRWIAFGRLVAKRSATLPQLMPTPE